MMLIYGEVMKLDRGRIHKSRRASKHFNDTSQPTEVNLNRKGHTHTMLV